MLARKRPGPKQRGEPLQIADAPPQLVDIGGGCGGAAGQLAQPAQPPWLLFLGGGVPAGSPGSLAYASLGTPGNSSSAWPGAPGTWGPPAGSPAQHAEAAKAAPAKAAAASKAAAKNTLQEAIEQAAEEIMLYHHQHGFPFEFTNHAGRDAQRNMSHQGDYIDRGCWSV